MPRKRAPVKANGVGAEEVKQEEGVAGSGGDAEVTGIDEEMAEEPKIKPEETLETDQQNDSISDADKKPLDNGDASCDDEQGDDEETDEARESKAPKSLYIKVIGFKRLPNLEDELKLYHRFFTEAMGVAAPKIQIPGPDDRWIYFELQSLEDKAKLFEELKAKGHNWEGYKISIKSVMIRAQEEPKELRRLTVEEAVNVLYPLKDIPYAQQLKDKLTRAKELVDEVIPRESVQKYSKSKKYVNNLRVKDLIPMLPIEGHEYTATIYFEECAETGNILYGLRAVSEDKEAVGIVPLNLCVSVPNQMKLLIESLAAHLPEIGLKPYNYSKKEGDLIGFTIKMTLCARFVITVILPKMPKISAQIFKQLSPDGIQKENEDDEGPSQSESYSVLIKKKIEEIKEKCEKYFNEEGKKYSLDSVYVTMSFPANLKEESSITPTHILGLSFVPDNLYGVLHRLTGERSRPPIDALRPILRLVEDHTGINSSSRVYLASPFRLVGLYFAKKCAHVTMFFSWTKENLSELQSWAKSMNLNNIEFTNAKTHHRKTFLVDNSVAIFWQFTKPTLADRLLASGIANVATVSYWNKNPPATYVEQQRKQYETIYSKLRINHIFPVDLAPFTERIGLAVFFTGMVPYGSGQQHFHREPVGGPMPLLGPHGPLPTSSRLGPPPPVSMRGGFGDRPAPWARPDPWGPPRSQLDQVASGVMQNLQAVQQQMQAFIPSLLDSNPMRPPLSAPWNKRNRDDFASDSWGYGKRRRDDRGDWKRNNYGKGKNKK